MKTTLLRCGALAFLLSTLNPQLSTLRAQGSINPTGTPGPTMRSLDQIEPRTPISSLPFTIGTGGSYYLTKSLSVSSGNGITITVDNVVLDLNGFTISSTANPAAGDAILLSGGRKNVRITNGNIAGSVTFNGSTFAGAGFQHGIVGTTTDPISTTVSFINISGLSGAGIYLGLGTSATLIDACNVYTVGGNGLTAVTITNSTAAQCGAAAITAHTVMNCRGDCVANDVGINATVAENCYAKSTNNTGILASTATNCYGANLLGSGSSAIGISAQSATGCEGVSNNGTGLTADVALNCQAVTNASTIAGVGLSAMNAENCYGNAGPGGSTGVYATGSAKNCYGIGGEGVYAQVAEGCTGLAGAESLAGTFGVHATMAIGCYGGSGPSAQHQVAYGVRATGSAVSCWGSGAQGDVQGDIVSFCIGENARLIGTVLFASDNTPFQNNGPYYYFTSHSGPTVFPQ